MNPSNYRVINTDQGYGVFRVYYDAMGSPVRRDVEPVFQLYDDSVCGLLDHLESISLAFEKPAIPGDLQQGV